MLVSLPPDNRQSNYAEPRIGRMGEYGGQDAQDSRPLGDPQLLGPAGIDFEQFVVRHQAALPADARSRRKISSWKGLSASMPISA